MNLRASFAEAWSRADRPGVKAFFLAIFALTNAFILAIYSGAAAQLGHVGLASVSALTALTIAGWVAVTLVPVLAKRTPLRWIGHRVEYKITRQGWVYIGGIILVALAAINTGNNLLFLILASLISTVLISGILSAITLTGLELRLELPENIFARQSVRASVTLENEKLTLPSFSLRVENAAKKGKPTMGILSAPVYFPYIPRHESAQQSVPLAFPKRGIYRQEALRISTKFPFGFLQKARRIDLAAEALVYPAIETSHEAQQVIAGLQGALASQHKGRGQDLYTLRDYQPLDSVRHVHWKASARTGELMVREFAHEEDQDVLLLFDPCITAPSSKAIPVDQERFERAIELCAAIAWSFHERANWLEFRSAGFSAPRSAAGESIFHILKFLALAQPLLEAENESLLADLAAESDAFEIVVTSRPHGAIPSSLWNQAYIVFAEDVAAG